MQSLGARSGESHEFERSQKRERTNLSFLRRVRESERSRCRCGTKHDFLRPSTVKAEGLRSGQVGAQLGWVEGAVRRVLRDGNRKVHSSLLRVNRRNA